MEEEKKEKGFVVRDKRHFDESGNIRTEESVAPPSSEPVGEPLMGSSVPDSDVREDKHPEAATPEVDFIGFILSLSTTAMYHFGDIPDPYTQKSEKNLAAAKQTIDILDMIREKTRGNLDEQEKELLEEALYELRMRFIKEKGAP
jgi:hypothetical protein